MSIVPELPEAETMARDLERRLKGRVLSEVLIAFEPIVAMEPTRFSELIAGHRVRRVGRLGKWIRLDLDNGATALFHLKMTGQFSMGPWPGDLAGPWPPHARVAFRVGEASGSSEEALFYHDIRKFGRLRAFSDSELPSFLEKLSLGPDALTVSPEDFYAGLKLRRGRLKAVLLDQSFLAGLGNIYADESLFASGLSPLRPADSLSSEESAGLLARVKSILTKAIEMRGSTVENYRGLEGGGDFQRFHQVYGKKGGLCPRCQTSLSCLTVGGRTTVYCPACQR
jgi:formamidopyrimidine-DNA glycosylase